MKKSFNIKLLILVLFAFVVTAFAESTSKPPKRIVSVGGGLTEIIYALGEKNALVGVDTTSKYPKEAMKLPQVGYQRRLSAEGILSLQPSLLIVTNDAGPGDVLQKIKSTGTPVVTLSHDYTVEGVVKNIQKVAQVLGKKTEGEVLNKKIENDYNKIKKALALIKNKNKPLPSVAFFIGMGKGSPMASGTGTSADSMIKMAGGKNVFESFSSYKQISQESMIEAAPDAILIARHAAKGLSLNDLLKHKAFSQTPAAKNKKIIIVDTLLMLGFGPRIVEAIDTLAKQIHSVDKL